MALRYCVFCSEVQSWLEEPPTSSTICTERISRKHNPA